jgi:cytochrome b561
MVTQGFTPGSCRPSHFVVPSMTGAIAPPCSENGWNNVMKKYDSLTRLLHLCLAAGISAQMFVSLVMITPKPGRDPNSWYSVHETLGIVLFAILAVYWLRAILKTIQGGEPMMLFPWLSPARLGALAQDIGAYLRDLARFRLSGDDGTRPLPAAIQGLGLMIGLILGGTGTVLAFGIVPGVKLSPVLHDIKELHEAFGPLMWGYLAIHPTMAILHQLAGHKTLNRMFGREA